MTVQTLRHYCHKKKEVDFAVYGHGVVVQFSRMLLIRLYSKLANRIFRNWFGNKTETGLCFRLRPKCKSKVYEVKKIKNQHMTHQIHMLH